MDISKRAKVSASLASLALISVAFMILTQGDGAYGGPAPASKAVDNVAAAPSKAAMTALEPSPPTLGAHALAFHKCGGIGDLLTAPIATHGSGSTILAWVGRGKLSAFTPATAPTDNKGNAYRMLGSAQAYSPLWPNSGEAAYASSAAGGGDGHVVTAPVRDADEVTLAVVEIENGGAIQDYAWNKMLSGQANASLNVTTVGPATLVAVWTGDSSGDSTSPNVSAVPNNGFTIIESQLYAQCGVEAVVATKDVAEAGTYNVAWTATPAQGAHLWLVAVQKASN